MPASSRPSIASGYGISRDEAGLLDWAWAEERLVRSRNYWLSTADRSGVPHAAPLWGVWLAERFLFGTDDAARKARNLAANPRGVLHLESGDEVVIVETEVDAAAGGPLRLRGATAYKEKYDVDTGDGSGLMALKPVVAFAWTESDFPTTATRFDFA